MCLLTKRAIREHLSLMLDTIAQAYPCGSVCPRSVGKRNASGIQMMSRSSTRSWLTPTPTLPHASISGRHRRASWEIVSASKLLQLSMWDPEGLLIWSIFYFWHLPSEGFTKKCKIYLPSSGDIGSGRLDILIPTCGSLDNKTAQSVLSQEIYLLWRTWVTMCVLKFVFEETVEFIY